MLLETHSLTKHFSINKQQTVHAVDDLTLGIEKNEIVGLVGESGSGKSTLGKTIVGLYEKTKGEVWFKGEKLPDKYTAKDYRKYSKKIQMIFQDPYSSLNPRMTVQEIVAEGLRIGGLRSTYADKVVKEEVAESLRKVGLQPDQMSRYPHEFSGGQRQRIGIARALIVRPEFVVCDEPISALDVSVQAQVINLLSALKESMGLTLLFIAHDLSMVRYISDRTAVMYLGSLVEVGKTSEVFFSPKHPYTQLLIDANPEADPKLERARKHHPIQGEIPSPINIKPGCRFQGRCPKVMDVCKEKTPNLITLTNTHDKEPRKVACHLYT